MGTLISPHLVEVSQKKAVDNSKLSTWYIHFVNLFIGKSSSESKGFVIQSNSGRRVVQVEEYMQLAELWRAKAVIALADEVGYITLTM